MRFRGGISLRVIIVVGGRSFVGINDTISPSSSALCCFGAAPQLFCCCQPINRMYTFIQPTTTTNELHANGPFGVQKIIPIYTADRRARLGLIAIYFVFHSIRVQREIGIHFPIDNDDEHTISGRSSRLWMSSACFYLFYDFHGSHDPYCILWITQCFHPGTTSLHSPHVSRLCRPNWIVMMESRL